jgi:hypothetical protein
MTQPKKKQLILLLLIMLLAAAACARVEMGEVALEASPPPTRPAVTPTADPASLNLLRQRDQVRPTVTPLPSSTVVPDEAVVPAASRLNTWLQISPLPGWYVWEGVDGVAVSPTTSMQGSFLTIRRWHNPLTIQDWAAYLPDGVAERESYVTIRMGQQDWDGVFVSAADGQWRAFFAISGHSPSYSLLVYVPAGFDLTDSDGLLAAWEREAPAYNSILYTVSVTD